MINLAHTTNISNIQVNFSNTIINITYMFSILFFFFFLPVPFNFYTVVFLFFSDYSQILYIFQLMNYSN